MGLRGEVYSRRMASQNEKRTYFFNIKQNHAGDLSLSLVESIRQQSEGDFKRQQIIIYEEDMKDFLEHFEQTVKEFRQRAASDHSADE